MTVDVCVVVDKMRAACRLDAERVCWWWSVVVDNKDFLDLSSDDLIDSLKARSRVCGPAAACCGHGGGRSRRIVCVGIRVRLLLLM